MAISNSSLLANTATAGNGGALCLQPARPSYVCANGAPQTIGDLVGDLSAVSPGQAVPLVPLSCTWQLQTPPGCVTELVVLTMAQTWPRTTQLLVRFSF